ncbi:KilA-N domain-containing protein [Aquabacter cavernae]|uniref:KilA-N domain-containing protein n=1 Tax=Aquabacter cavernae TaxID=2496029 RepID=UPI000F8ED882
MMRRGAHMDHVAISHNLTVGQVMTTKRGKGGGTYAHWQIGLAYAKYLSPEFHMWRNTAVREVL